MARRKGPSDSDVETLEAPPEGLPDTAGEEAAVEHGDTLDIRALHDIKIPQLLKIAMEGQRPTPAAGVEADGKPAEGGAVAN